MPFHLHEIFFSRSDERGVIQSGNNVFQRVSGYPWEALIGAPHKLVRHPDMPQAVFWLFWDTITAGKPIGAFLKNRAQDGRYYWVFAIATPVDDGFLSVRFKPTSPLLQKIISHYSELREFERTSGVSPEESATVLLKKLKAMGFATYEEFMTYAIVEETVARDTGLGRPSDQAMIHYATMRATLQKIQQNAQAIVEGFKGIQTSPKNMRIQSARLGEVAAPLSVISANFDVLADSIRTRVNAFLLNSETVLAKATEGLFVNCARNIQQEAISMFRPEDYPQKTEFAEEEANRLKAVSADYTATIKAALQDIQFEVSNFTEMCVQLKRTLSGLSVTRVMSQIESARIGDTTGGMGEIISQLAKFQVLTYDCLRTIENECAKLRSDIEPVTASAKRLTFS